MHESFHADESVEDLHASAETGRIEAFSDGVFAVAITLLALDLHLPAGLGPSSDLAGALEHLWPAYLAFGLSFALIGIMWVNHHRLFVLIDRVDHTLMVLNGVLLLGITFVPFPTSVLAAYLGTAQERAAAVFYNGTYAFIALVFFVLWGYAVRHPRLLHPSAHGMASQIVSRTYLFGPPGYILAVTVSLVSAPAGVALNMLLALLFALPPQIHARMVGLGSR